MTLYDLLQEENKKGKTEGQRIFEEGVIQKLGNLEKLKYVKEIHVYPHGSDGWYATFEIESIKYMATYDPATDTVKVERY